MGVSVVAFDVGLTTLLQIGSDDSNRGRVSALMQTAMALSQLIAMGITSLVADNVDVVLLLDIAGILFGVGGLVALWVPRHAHRRASLAPAPLPAE